MGLRFRKSIGLTKGIRLNLNKDSVGLSVGTKGARYSVNSKGGKTATVGIPGSGLYYTENLGKKKKASPKKSGFGGLWLIFLPLTLLFKKKKK